jgi:hypothetical protein
MAKSPAQEAQQARYEEPEPPLPPRKPPMGESRESVVGLEAIHTRVAHALENAYEQLRVAQDAELALRNYEVARKHDFAVEECQATLSEALAALTSEQKP